MTEEVLNTGPIMHDSDQRAEDCTSGSNGTNGSTSPLKSSLKSRIPLPPIAPKPRNKDQINFKRRKAWIHWAPYGLHACHVMKGGTCPYYKDHCKHYKLWHVRSGMAYPVCGAQREVFQIIYRDLITAGLPKPLCASLAGNLVRSINNDDLRLCLESQKAMTSLTVELFRLKAQKIAKGEYDAIADVDLSQVLQRLESENEPVSGALTGPGDSNE